MEEIVSLKGKSKLFVFIIIMVSLSSNILYEAKIYIALGRLDIRVYNIFVVFINLITISLFILYYSKIKSIYLKVIKIKKIKIIIIFETILVFFMIVYMVVNGGIFPGINYNIGHFYCILMIVANITIKKSIDSYMIDLKAKN